MAHACASFVVREYCIPKSAMPISGCVFHVTGHQKADNGRASHRMRYTVPNLGRGAIPMQDIGSSTTKQVSAICPLLLSSQRPSATKSAARRVTIQSRYCVCNPVPFDRSGIFGICGKTCSPTYGVMHSGHDSRRLVIAGKCVPCFIDRCFWILASQHRLQGRYSNFTLVWRAWTSGEVLQP